jgi:acyl dehydratase
MTERAGLDFDSLQVGDTLPGFQTEPLSRLALALYCGASGDHNPIHVDIDFARAAGQPDVFAHGMLSMAYLGRLLTRWVPQQSLRQFGVRFVALTHVGDRVGCRGTVVEKFESDGERRVRLELSTVDADGRVKLSGDAVVALP